MTADDAKAKLTYIARGKKVFSQYTAVKEQKKKKAAKGKGKAKAGGSGTKPHEPAAAADTVANNDSSALDVTPDDVPELTEEVEAEDT